MANSTFTQLRTLGGGGSVNAEDFNSRLLTTLAILASGMNPDGTTFTPPAGVTGFMNGFGSEGNLWSAAAVGAGGTSATFFAGVCRNWMIIGNVSAATTLTVQVTPGATWRSSSVSLALAGAGDFSIDCRALLGATYIRLLSSAAATISASALGNY